MPLLNGLVFPLKKKGKNSIACLVAYATAGEPERNETLLRRYEKLNPNCCTKYQRGYVRSNATESTSHESVVFELSQSFLGPPSLPCDLVSVAILPWLISRSNRPEAASGRLKFHMFLKAASSLSLGRVFTAGRRLTTLRQFSNNTLCSSL